MNALERYTQWNAALLKQFFNPRSPGDPVYLAVDDDELEEMAPQLEVSGDPAADLSRAVRARVASSGGLADFARQARRWRTRADEPPYVAFLALAVLAASRMAAEPEKGVHANDYYARLNPLLGHGTSGGMPSSFELVDKLWEDFALWLDHDLSEARGRSTVRTHPHFVHIGWPLSQCVLRATDRARLPDFFRFAGFEPREVVSGQRLLALFRVWAARAACGLSTAGRNTAATTTNAMQDQLADVLETELAAWDGELRDSRGRRRGEILLFAERRAGGRRMELSMYARRPDEFPDGAFTTDNGSSMHLHAASDGWYRRLPVEVDAPRLAKSLHMTQGNYSVVFQPEDVLPMREAFQPSSGWLEARQAIPFEPHMVLFRATLEPTVRAFAERYAERGWKIREPVGLPQGWKLLDGLVINSAPKTVVTELARLAPRFLTSLSLVGGLRLGARDTYLAGGEPDLQVTFEGDEQALVTLDGFEQRFATAAVELRLADHLSAPGDHLVEIPGQRRMFTSLDGLGLIRPDQAGAMALTLERHSTYMPTAAEAGPVSSSPPRGRVHISGAHIDAAPEDLPLVPPRPVVLMRNFERWQLLGAYVGDAHDGGPTPLDPDWFRDLPGKPSCQFFEVYPRFAPELVVYTGKGGVLVRAVADELCNPFAQDDLSTPETIAWVEIVLETRDSDPRLDHSVEVVWPRYVSLAEELAR